MAHTIASHSPALQMTVHPLTLSKQLLLQLSHAVKMGQQVFARAAGGSSRAGWCWALDFLSLCYLINKMGMHHYKNSTL